MQLECRPPVTNCVLADHIDLLLYRQSQTSGASAEKQNVEMARKLPCVSLLLTKYRRHYFVSRGARQMTEIFVTEVFNDAKMTESPHGAVHGCVVAVAVCVASRGGCAWVRLVCSCVCCLS